MKIVEMGTVTFTIKGTVTSTVFGQIRFLCKDGNRPSDPRNPHCEYFVLDITYSVTTVFR
jgi:hypothetical protein